MLTAALFVDAGYLFSAGSDLVFGAARPRRALRLDDVPGLIGKVTTAAVTCCADELRVLRTYWYDGAVGGVPTAEQIAIGELPQVKLRLGRVSSGGQKGVDGLIILDLLNLARNRAVDVAIVLSGDEDLREAALHAQGFGVSLVVAGFPRTARQGQSRLLLREADHVVHLSRDDIAAHLSAVEPEVSLPEPEPVVPEAPDDAAAERALRDVCRSVVEDPRFAESGLVSGGARISYRADKVLVARLAELTGTFPVDADLLARARTLCVELARSSVTL
jgi:hypothetical protein